ncbi:hypothetical protein L7F22_055437, partial [Adiantum nelumboides]|nr:hypothetical protein [Adiantum nelumboides]
MEPLGLAHLGRVLPARSSKACSPQSQRGLLGRGSARALTAQGQCTRLHSTKARLHSTEGNAAIITASRAADVKGVIIYRYYR